MITIRISLRVVYWFSVKKASIASKIVVAHKATGNWKSPEEIAGMAKDSQNRSFEARASRFIIQSYSSTLDLFFAY